MILGLTTCLEQIKRNLDMWLHYRNRGYSNHGCDNFEISDKDKFVGIELPGNFEKQIKHLEIAEELELSENTERTHLT